MAHQNYAGISPLPWKAGAAVTQYRAVKLDTTQDQVIHTTANTEICVGAALTDAASGAEVAVQWAGVAKMMASAAISLGAQVQAGASGKVATASGATAVSIGIALAAAAADGDIIPVLLRIPNVNGPANS